MLSWWNQFATIGYWGTVPYRHQYVIKLSLYWTCH